MKELLPRINYIYNFCNDLAATRQFYSEGIGLTEGMYEPKYGCLSYKLQGMEFMFWKWEDELKKPNGFAGQPGGGGGDLPLTSWTIAVSETEFPLIVSRIQKLKAETKAGKPQFLQNSYWGFVVKDPAGNTVEICTYPSERPELTEWE